MTFVKGDFIEAAKTLRDFAKTNKDNYRRLREQYPQLPSQFVCVGMRDAAGFREP